jgi:hypothetical protein
MTTTNTELVERMARAMLVDELQGTNRDFDQVWADEGPVWLKNAASALEVVRPMLEAAYYDGYTDGMPRNSVEAINEDWAESVTRAALNAGVEEG